MKKPILNKEIYFKSQKDYLTNLFNQLKEKKVKYETQYGIVGITDELGLVFHIGDKDEKDKLDRFEHFVWFEYERCLAERKQLKEVVLKDE